MVVVNDSVDSVFVEERHEYVFFEECNALVEDQISRSVNTSERISVETISGQTGVVTQIDLQSGARVVLYLECVGGDVLQLRVRE